MQQGMPVGIPFYYEPIGNGLFSRRLCSERRDFSWEALDWLNYMSDDPRFSKATGGFYNIRCIINGEKSVKTSLGTYRVDGYVETSDQIYLLEYNGCRYHSCPNCLYPTPCDTTERDEKKLKGLAEIGTVIVMRGCQWHRMRRRRRTRVSPFSTFYYENKVAEENILRAIQCDKFFGIANVDIYAPDSVREDYKVINFPPLFLRRDPKMKELSPKMAEFYASYGTKPTKQLSVGFSGNEITLSTDYLKFLIDVGFKVSKLHWALEYQKGLSIKFSDKLTFNY